jgi:hypothetical protein
LAASIAMDGKLDLSSFTDEAANRPAVQDMLKRVTIKNQTATSRPNATMWGLATHPADARRIVAFSCWERSM